VAVWSLVSARDFYREALGNDDGCVSGLVCLNELAVVMSEQLRSLPGDHPAYPLRLP
jgi:hypothetical protein